MRRYGAILLIALGCLSVPATAYARAFRSIAVAEHTNADFHVDGRRHLAYTTSNGTLTVLAEPSGAAEPSRVTFDAPGCHVSDAWSARFLVSCTGRGLPALFDSRTNRLAPVPLRLRPGVSASGVQANFVPQALGAYWIAGYEDVYREPDPFGRRPTDRGFGAFLNWRTGEFRTERLGDRLDAISRHGRLRAIDDPLLRVLPHPREVTPLGASGGWIAEELLRVAQPAALYVRRAGSRLRRRLSPCSSTCYPVTFAASLLTWVDAGRVIAYNLATMRRAFWRSPDRVGGLGQTLNHVFVASYGGAVLPQAMTIYMAPRP